MKKENAITRECPRCGVRYSKPPALSRTGYGYICPDCGTREALAGLGISEDEQEHIIQIINRYE